MYKKINFMFNIIIFKTLEKFIDTVSDVRDYA